MDGSSNPDSLDPISLQVLLLLSSGQRLTIQEIARAIGQKKDTAMVGVMILEDLNFISQEDERYHLTRTGFTHLAEKRGIRPTKPQPSVKADESYTLPSPSIFGSWKDLVLWLIFPILITMLVLILPTILIASADESFSIYVFVGAELFTLISGSIFLWRRFRTLLPAAISLFIFGITIFFITRIDTPFLKLGFVSLLLALLILLLLQYWMRSYRIVIENERLVIFRLGHCIDTRGPGPVIILPFIDNPQVVDLRVNHKEVSHETCITRDNVQIDVDFVFYWKIQQAEWSLTKVKNPEESIQLLATAILRAVIARFSFNDVQEKRQSINEMLKEEIDAISSEWGVYVTTMEIREVKASDEIVKAMEKRRAAEWESEAIETLARGQAEALKVLFTIASQIDTNTLNLKYFETLQKLGEGQSTKYIFPMELSNLVQSWLRENPNSNNLPALGQDKNPPNKES